MSIINGYSYSRVRCESAVTETRELDLPLTNYNGGLVESYSVIKTQPPLIGSSATERVLKFGQRIYGFYIYFNYSFSDFISGEAVMKFKEIIEYAKGGADIYLTPRVDQPWRYFKVLLNSDNFDLALRRGGANAKYHKGFNVSFVTEFMQTSLNWNLVIPPSTYPTAVDDTGKITLIA